MVPMSNVGKLLTFGISGDRLSACLKKVHLHASDTEALLPSALQKLDEFRRLSYPVSVLRGAWVETWASCTLFWVPYMSANFALVPAALRVRAMAVGNLAWCVVIDYLAHRGHGAAASAAG